MFKRLANRPQPPILGEQERNQMTDTPTHSISPQSLTFEEFIAQYGDNPRYELIDGVLRDMEPTGPHEDDAGNLSARIYGEILRSGLNWLIPKSCLIKPPALEATALRPDVVVLDRHRLSQEPLWQREPILSRVENWTFKM